MVTTRTRRGIIALSLLCALSFWLNRQQGSDEQGPIEGLDTRFDYTLDNFRMRVFDQDGLPAVTIVAPRLANDAGSGVSTIRQPSVQVHHEGAQWNIMAETAKVSNDRELVLLNGEVRLQRQPNTENPPMNMLTRDVQLQITPRLASSDQFVEVTEPGAMISGRGFEVDMTSDRFKIHEQVKGSYEAQ
jgi:lipopolysaccharide export system protein LptC